MSGEKYESHARNLTDFLGRWGTSFQNIRSLWNSVVPVAVVDRFRDDTEGSLWGCNAYNAGAFNRYPAAVLFNPVHDIEVFAVSVWHQPWQQTQGFHVYSPIAPYNPISGNLTGAFQPGLITNRGFTFPTSFVFTGTNINLPPIWGDWTKCNVVAVAIDPGTRITYDPPIRVFRDGSLCVQLTTKNAGAAIELYASFLWRERPRTTPGP